MAKFVVASPTGQKFEVNAPEGTSQEEVLSYAQQQFAQANKKPEPSAVDRAGNAAAGFNYGAIPGTLGLPVDTIQNAIDLGKAGLGYLTSKVTGSVPDALVVNPDRSGVVGSSQWLANRIRRVPLGTTLIDNRHPEDAASRLLYAGGNAAGGAVSGNRAMGLPTPVSQLPGAAISGVAAQAVSDATDDPALAVLAGMSPTVAAQVAAGTTRGVMRGGEANRARMQQNIADARRNGVDLSVGQASQSAAPQLLEGLLSKMPGGYGVFRRKGAEQQLALADALTEMTPGKNEPDVSGRIIQTGIQSKSGEVPGFAERVKARQEKLYERMGEHIPKDAPSNVDATVAALRDLNADIPGAPNTSKLFKNARIAGIEQQILADLSQDRAYTPSQLAEALRTNPQRAADLNAALGEGSLPYEAVKKTRTLVGNEITDGSLLSDVPRSKWKALYGALSNDMGKVAADAGPEATAAFNRANRYTKASIDRLERLEPLTNAKTPEQAFYSLVNSANSGPTQINAVKRSLTPTQWKEVVSNVVNDLGKARPGQQNAAGDAFSSETFLTNWNKLDPKAKSALVGGFEGAEVLRDRLNAMASTSSLMRQSAKVLANPSGTGPVVSTGNLLTGSAVGSLLNPWALALAPAALGTSYGGAKLLTNPNYADWLAKRTAVSPELQAANAARLAEILSNQAKEDRDEK